MSKRSRWTFRVCLLVMVLAVLGGSGPLGAQEPASGQAEQGRELVAVPAKDGVNLLLPDGSRYIGEFARDRINGLGLLAYADGRRYVGQFKENQLEGSGSLLFPDGTIYVGHFTTGQFNGDGLMVYPDGRRYMGQFRGNSITGLGHMTFPDGTQYTGEFKAGLFDGQGTLAFTNGKHYSGTFRQGDFHGDGRVRYADGSRVEGLFWKNKLIETKGVQTPLKMEPPPQPPGVPAAQQAPPQQPGTGGETVAEPAETGGGAPTGVEEPPAEPEPPPQPAAVVEPVGAAAAGPLKEFKQEISLVDPLEILTPGEETIVAVRVKNTSGETWHAKGSGDRGIMNRVRLAGYWMDAAGKKGDWSGTTLLPGNLGPGSEVVLDFNLKAPSEAGQYVLLLTMLQEGVAWFHQKGALPLEVEVRVE